MLTSLFSAQGYDVAKTLTSNHRFASFRLAKNGQEFFGKICIDPALVRELENEIWFNLTLQRLTEADPRIAIRPPKLVASGTGWYIADFLPGRPLIPNNPAEIPSLRPHLDRLAELLSRLDGSLLVRAAQPLYESSNSAPYTNLLAKVDTWLAKPLKHGDISQAKVGQAKQLIEKYKADVQASFQHGDFVPWHIIVAKDDAWYLTDGEHASLVKPRFYDLAYLYSRLFTRLKAAGEAARLLQLFLNHLDQPKPQFTSAFLPVLTLRALGTCADARADLPDIDYRAEAADLLNRCLKEDVQTLLE